MKSIFKITYISCALIIYFSPGTSFADYEDGVEAAFAGDFETAFTEFTIAAQDGLSLAQYNLGILYFTGQGVSQNLEEAFKWTKAAAEQGHLNAQFNLGSLYLDGQGTKTDVSEGINWFTRAAKNGHDNSAYSLAKIYQEGDLFDSDLVQAHAWAAQAEINKHPEGNSLKNEIAQDLSDEEISQARRLFAVWQIE
tara:strand:+ start:434 stop:1018 length:585 start_codon:yes stop_codon:yes gene_type:complete